MDGVIQVSLKEGTRRQPSTSTSYGRCSGRIPEEIIYFQAADMVTQIMNFGVPGTDSMWRTVGYDRAKKSANAHELRHRIADIPGIADAHLQQEVNARIFSSILTQPRHPVRPYRKSIVTNLNVS